MIESKKLYPRYVYEYKHNRQGKVIFTRVSQYNKQRLCIRLDDSDGYWCKYKYNKRGRITSQKSSNGEWCNRRFNQLGKETYYEDSEGYWHKRRYSTQGKQTYYEDQSGKVVKNTLLSGLK